MMNEPMTIVVKHEGHKIGKCLLQDVNTFKNAFIVSIASLTAAWVFDLVKKRVSKKGE